MEIVTWKTQGGKTLEEANKAKPTYYAKIWEKYRNTKKKNKVIEKTASSKFILMLKINWWNMVNFNKL